MHANMMVFVAFFAFACFASFSMGEEAAVSSDNGRSMSGFSAENEEAFSANAESFEFQAEVNRLMDIIINSLYKNKEVFLRELISNASDALDKIRFLVLSQPEMLGDTKDLDIKISFNEELKTLTIRDTGVGMTKAELVANLGTVAKSGTTSFVEQLSQGQDMGLIGQFGVGFYAVYLVADKVRVISKNNDDEQYIWESTADSSFTVAQDPRGNTLGRGTEITLFLKEDAHDLVSQDRLEELVVKYSEFVTFPIYLYKATKEVVETETEEEEEEESTTDSEDELNVEDETEEEEESATEEVTTWDWHHLNTNVAIWSRDIKEVTDDEYQNFFKAIAKDASAEARTWIHFKAEGEVEFKSILFVPAESGNLYNEYSERKASIRLFVRKVLIQDDFEELLPRYLNFIRGVVDSDDLPLNVSRDTLQQHKVLKVVGKKLVRKVLEMLRKLAAEDDKEEEENEEDDEDKAISGDSEYIKFWEQFGKSIKMGIVEDTPNRSKLAKLLRFKTSTSDDKYASLDKYISRMPEWQKDIYFVAGETMEAVQKSPFLNAATKRNVEVLYLTDPIDEYAFQYLGDYDGHKLVSLTKEGLKFGDEDEDLLKKRAKAYKENFKPLTKFMKDLFGGKVSKVAISQRDDAAPCVIVASQYGHSANMERIMKAQTFASPDQQMQASQRIFEINPRHPLIVEMNQVVTSGKDSDATKDLAHLLYDTAVIASGFSHDSVESFADRMYRTLASQMSVSSMDLVEEIEVEEDEEEEEEDNSHDEF